ncbi:hypothetical protein LDENG_00275870, partial [Lucifuga dentata]
MFPFCINDNITPTGMDCTSCAEPDEQNYQHDLTMFQRASCDVRLSDYFQIYMENITDFQCGLRLLDSTE